MNQLKDFQKTGVDWLKENFRCILADEMGLGKTVQVAGLINTCPGIQRVLIVCPASLKQNWYNELTTWLTRPLSIQIVSGKKDVVRHSNITIINYDILSAHGGALVHGKPCDSKGHIYDLVVFDEAHYLKNPAADRTAAARCFAPRTPRLVFLTGTPLVNRPADLFVMLHAINPEITKNQRDFETRYCGGHMERLQFGKKIVRRWNNLGATNIEELKEKLAPVMLRRLKSEVLSELPPKTHQIIELDGDDTYAGVPLKGAWWNDLEHVSVSATARARKACGMEKIGKVIRHVKLLLEEKDKVVVFAHHQDVVHSIAAAFTNHAVCITGSTPAHLRQGYVNAFQKDKNIKVFVGNIQAAGVGLTLTASDIVVFAELDWVPGNMRQAEDRCHRIGQKNNVLVQYLVSPGVDAEIGRALARKIEVIEATIGGAK
jgi:SWI/SNF-related matrix-associated actin-dependent regulator of chromatin subfamily A-like protein 1